MDEQSKAIANIFISYAHADEDLKKELDKYLKVLKRSSKIQSWNDRDLIPGQEYDAEIMSALGNANVILLLISIDFNSSDFIWDKELAAAMKRHEEGTAHVVPVILRRCDWSKMPYAKLQALPRNARPVTEYDNRDEAFTEIAKGIESLVDYMNSRQATQST
jgi:TIR domain